MLQFKASLGYISDFWASMSYTVGYCVERQLGWR